MKKYYMSLLALMTTSTLFAQTTLWNGENYNIGDKGGCWDDGSPSVVENPDKAGINPSEKCLAFTMTSSSKVVKIPFRDWVQPAMDGSRRVSLMVRKSNDCNVQIEISDPTDGSAGYWQKVAAWYGGGGEWQKVVFDFSLNDRFDYPGVISITATTDDVHADEMVYIDNVQIEPAARVNGMLLADVADGSLEGSVVLTGAWMKGDCQRVTDFWTRNDYDDFGLLRGKLSATATSVDMTAATLKDAYNPFSDVNPNILVYASAWAGEGNVIVNGTAGHIALDGAHAFGCPVAFHADAVTLSRGVVAGNNAFCLPFAAGAEEMGAASLAVYSGMTGTEDVAVTFTNSDKVEVYQPFLAYFAEAAESVVFSGKDFEATPAGATGDAFRGTLAPQAAEGLWLMPGGDAFVKGEAGASVPAFQAYLELQAGALSVKADGITTGVEDARFDDYAVDGGAVVRLDGTVVMRNAGVGDLRQLKPGMYVFNKRKFCVR